MTWSSSGPYHQSEKDLGHSLLTNWGIRLHKTPQGPLGKKHERERERKRVETQRGSTRPEKQHFDQPFSRWFLSLGYGDFRPMGYFLLHQLLSLSLPSPIGPNPVKHATPHHRKVFGSPPSIQPGTRAGK